jgi:hypothetical protein
MDKMALKEILYGSLKELMTNPKFIYVSSIDPSYSEWTESGTKEVMQFLKQMSFLIAQSEREDMDRRAKEIVLGNLKSNG